MSEYATIREALDTFLSEVEDLLDMAGTLTEAVKNLARNLETKMPEVLDVEDDDEED
jgi:hypothetical protein